MKVKLVYTINLVLVLNCVIIVAKNETNEKKLESKLNQSIYAEGFSQHDNEVDEHKPRIKGRKGVNENEIPSPATNETKIDDESAHNVSKISTPAPSVHNISSSSLPVNVTSKPNIDQKTTTLAPSNPINNSMNSTITTNVSNLKNVTSTTTKTTTTTSSTTTTTTTTTKKPVKKPEVTYSADDNPEILESEKNINYNVANEKPQEIPKVETDIDRSILDEKRARNSYMIYLGLVFALPMSFVLINIAYKRIKNYMELRHYQRVDFLVDGMYVS